MTDELAPTSPGSRVRRTTVPHPQRWRSPHDAGWSGGRTATATTSLRRSAPAAVGRFGRPVRRFRRVIVHSATPADGAAWAEAKRVELEIFAIRNGWATDASVAAGEVLDYAPFDDRSELFVATHISDPNKPMGVARMIWGAPDLPLAEQFLVTSVHRIDPEWSWMLQMAGFERVAEWATLGAVGTNLSPMFALWTTLYRTARERGVDYWVQSIVESLFGGYRDGFKMPMMQIGEREFVIGADSIPSVILLEEGAVGRMLDFDLDLKREIFGPWLDRPRPPRDPSPVLE